MGDTAFELKMKSATIEHGYCHIHLLLKTHFSRIVHGKEEFERSQIRRIDAFKAPSQCCDCFP